ncbi:unnamed protein product [Sphagnum jensenii]|jgi:hypothetical protein|uniref:Uncharacterized protein n=1 Tax=Sphagnum jensenii TaxID=128206 RepID=A0ABP0WE92_9BRYO
MMMMTTTSQSGDDLRRPIIKSGPKFLSRLRHYLFADLDVQSDVTSHLRPFPSAPVPLRSRRLSLPERASELLRSLSRIVAEPIPYCN